MVSGDVVGIDPDKMARLISELSGAASDFQNLAGQMRQIAARAGQPGYRGTAVGQKGAGLHDRLPGLRARLDLARMMNSTAPPGSIVSFPGSQLTPYLQGEEQRQALADARALQAALGNKNRQQGREQAEEIAAELADTRNATYRDAFVNAAAPQLAGLARVLNTWDGTVAAPLSAGDEKLLAAFAGPVVQTAAGGGLSAGAEDAFTQAPDMWSAGMLLACGPGGSAYGNGPGARFLAAMGGALQNAFGQGKLTAPAPDGPYTAAELVGLARFNPFPGVLDRISQNPAAVNLFGPEIRDRMFRMGPGDRSLVLPGVVMSPQEEITVADVLRGFATIRSSYVRYLKEKAENLGTEKERAYKEYERLRNRPGGRNAADTRAAEADFEARQREFRAAVRDLAVQQGKELPLLRMLNTSTAEAGQMVGRLAAGGPGGVSGAARGADAAAEAADASRWARIVRLAGGIPVLEVTAAGLATYFDTRADMARGEPWYSAAAKEAASNAGGIAVGEGVAALTGLALFAAPEEVAVGVGAAVGAVATAPAADFFHNLFNEPWRLDWKQRGVLDGTGHAIVDSGDHTRHDMAHLADDLRDGVKNVAGKLWHDVL